MTYLTEAKAEVKALSSCIWEVMKGSDTYNQNLHAIYQRLNNVLETLNKIKVKEEHNNDEPDLSPEDFEIKAVPNELAYLKNQLVNVNANHNKMKLEMKKRRDEYTTVLEKAFKIITEMKE